MSGFIPLDILFTGVHVIMKNHIQICLRMTIINIATKFLLYYLRTNK